MDGYIHNEYLSPQPRVRPVPDTQWPARRHTAVALARGLSAALMATVLSVLIVVADKLVDSWSHGGLVVALLVLWLVVFAGLALFARSSAYLALRAARLLQRRPALAGDPAAGAYADPVALSLAPRALADMNEALARQQPAGLTPGNSMPVFYRPW